MSGKQYGYKSDSDNNIFGIGQMFVIMHLKQ